jgi:hypothetical protein
MRTCRSGAPHAWLLLHTSAYRSRCLVYISCDSPSCDGEGDKAVSSRRTKIAKLVPLCLSRAHLAGLRRAGGGVEVGVGLGVVGVEGRGPRPFEVDCEPGASTSVRGYKRVGSLERDARRAPLTGVDQDGDGERVHGVQHLINQPGGVL